MTDSSAAVRTPEEPRDGQQSLAWRVPLAVVVMCLVWGSTWLVVRKGLEEMPPLGSAGIRFFLAWLIILPISSRLARAEGGTRPTFDLVIAMATCNFAISYGIVYWAEQVLHSSLAAILWGVYPLVTALVGHVYMRESRIVGLQWLGLVVGFVGVVLLMVTDVPAVGDGAVVRSLVLLLSPIVSALATAYIKRHGAGTSSILLNRAGMFWGSLLLILSAVVVEGGLPIPSTPQSVLSLVYLSAFGTVLTFSLYFWVLRVASAVSLSLIAYVTPAIALLLGSQLDGDPVTGWTIAGLGLILLGCVGVLRRPTH